MSKKIGDFLNQNRNKKIVKRVGGDIFSECCKKGSQIIDLKYNNAELKRPDNTKVKYGSDKVTQKEKHLKSDYKRIPHKFDDSFRKALREIREENKINNKFPISITQKKVGDKRFSSIQWLSNKRETVEMAPDTLRRKLNFGLVSDNRDSIRSKIVDFELDKSNDSDVLKLDMNVKDYLNGKLRTKHYSILSRVGNIGKKVWNSKLGKAGLAYGAYKVGKAAYNKVKDNPYYVISITGSEGQALKPRKYKIKVSDSEVSALTTFYRSQGKRAQVKGPYDKHQARDVYFNELNRYNVNRM